MTRAYLGIDLGTTNSAAAVFDGQTVALVRNATGATLTSLLIVGVSVWLLVMRFST